MTRLEDQNNASLEIPESWPVFMTTKGVPINAIHADVHYYPIPSIAEWDCGFPVMLKVVGGGLLWPDQAEFDHVVAIATEAGK